MWRPSVLGARARGVVAAGGAPWGPRHDGCGSVLQFFAAAPLFLSVGCRTWLRWNIRTVSLILIPRRRCPRLGWIPWDPLLCSWVVHRCGWLTSSGTRRPSWRWACILAWRLTSCTAALGGRRSSSCIRIVVWITQVRGCSSCTGGCLWPTLFLSRTRPRRAWRGSCSPCPVSQTPSVLVRGDSCRGAPRGRRRASLVRAPSGRGWRHRRRGPFLLLCLLAPRVQVRSCRRPVSSGPRRAPGWRRTCTWWPWFSRRILRSWGMPSGTGWLFSSRLARPSVPPC